MSKRMTGTILLILASEALGVLYAEWTNRLFLKMTPPVALSEFNRGAAHVTLLGSGAVLGLGIFLLALVAISLSGLFTARRADAPPSP